jgi:outer membrane protein W
MFSRRQPCRIVLGVVVSGCVWIGSAAAEWYVGGYGGLSAGGSLSNVTMPLLGQRLAEQQFPQANDPLDVNGRGTLTQTLKTSDFSLKHSAMFGGKVGYFFTDEKLPWLGIELEAFTTAPSIKSQTVDTRHDITYQPNTPAAPAQCLPPVPLPNCPAVALNQSRLSVQESSLRVTTLAFNLIARYPGDILQPYVGIGGGAFYFSSANGTFQGRQFYPGLNALVGVKLLIDEEWGLFAEGKYNMANISNFDPTFGLSGMYSIYHLVAGIAYHF